jgi:hypothetical protein
VLKKLLPPTGVPADFVDDFFHTGLVKLPDAMMVCLFNGDDKLRTLLSGVPNQA